MNKPKPLNPYVGAAGQERDQEMLEVLMRDAGDGPAPTESEEADYRERMRQGIAGEKEWTDLFTRAELLFKVEVLTDKEIVTSIQKALDENPEGEQWGDGFSSK